MEPHDDVIHQMEKIRYIFQQALYTSTEQEEIDAFTYLQKIGPEFRAVAYEGIAMGLAMKDFKVGTLQQWRSFMKSSDPAYVPHVHVGLGWAIAKQQIPSLSFIDPLDPLMLFRVLDGLGYYEGTFKKLQAITRRERSKAVAPADFQAYDQGVGRSIWYHCKGDCVQVSTVIQEFDVLRHPDLWRGIGIACSYVGGFHKSTLQDLLTYASVHHHQLAVGAAFTARARIQTNSMTNDSELACHVWSNLSAKEAMLLTVETEPNSGDNNEVYKTWVLKLGSELQLS